MNTFIPFSLLTFFSRKINGMQSWPMAVPCMKQIEIPTRVGAVKFVSMKAKPPEDNTITCHEDHISLPSLLHEAVYGSLS